MALSLEELIASSLGAIIQQGAAPLDVAALRRELGALEDAATATGWVWDAALSRRVDMLCMLIEGRRG